VAGASQNLHLVGPRGAPVPGKLSNGITSRQQARWWWWACRHRHGLRSRGRRGRRAWGVQPPRPRIKRPCL